MMKRTNEDNLILYSILSLISSLIGVIEDKIIPIRLDKYNFPCYTETVARVCVQAFGMLGDVTVTDLRTQSDPQ